MSTNEERRAEARQKLREQMDAQVRQEKRSRIIAGSLVVVLVASLLGWVLWSKHEDSQRIAAEEQARVEKQEYDAKWADCAYAPDTQKLEKIDLEKLEAEKPEQVAEAKEFNEAIEKARTVEPPEAKQSRFGTVEAVLKTNRGEIPITMDRSKAACNVANIEHLIDKKYYDDTVCHRLTNATTAGIGVLQCGDPTGTGATGPGYFVPDEPPAGVSPDDDGQYPRGTLAMAKTKYPDSAGSQFFLVYEDSSLPPEYSVLGKISEKGLKTIDAIAKKGTKSDDPQDPASQKPKEEVVIKTATVVDAK